MQACKPIGGLGSATVGQAALGATGSCALLALAALAYQSRFTRRGRRAGSRSQCAPVAGRAEDEQQDQQGKMSMRQRQRTVGLLPSWLAAALALKAGPRHVVANLGAPARVPTNSKRSPWCPGAPPRRQAARAPRPSGASPPQTPSPPAGCKGAPVEGCGVGARVQGQRTETGGGRVCASRCRQSRRAGSLVSTHTGP